jgi:hypothetical protein
MPPAPSFVKLCTEDGLTLPSSKADRLAFLNDGGVSIPAQISVRELAELVATLAWARHSLATDADPDSWSTTLPESLLGRLLSLYPFRRQIPTTALRSPTLSALLLSSLCTLRLRHSRHLRKPPSSHHLLASSSTPPATMGHKAPVPRPPALPLLPPHSPYRVQLASA